jgi:hypothetical protein
MTRKVHYQELILRRSGKVFLNDERLLEYRKITHVEFKVNAKLTANVFDNELKSLMV